MCWMGSRPAPPRSHRRKPGQRRPPRHHCGLPLHRLAVTAPAIDVYTPHLRRVLAELLGPPQSPEGWAYNFSQGPTLAEVPLFWAALLPLTFIAARERREDR